MTAQKGYQGPHHRAERGKEIPEERIFLLNELYWDRNFTQINIERQAKVSAATCTRAIFQYRADWERFKFIYNSRKLSSELIMEKI